jgi:hypothetical protein
MADLLVQQLGGQAFSWGGATLATTSGLRARYIDRENLREFVRIDRFGRRRTGKIRVSGRVDC